MGSVFLVALLVLSSAMAASPHLQYPDEGATGRHDEGFFHMIEAEYNAAVDTSCGDLRPAVDDDESIFRIRTHEPACADLCNDLSGCMRTGMPWDGAGDEEEEEDVPPAGDDEDYSDMEDYSDDEDYPDEEDSDWIPDHHQKPSPFQECFPGVEGMYCEPGMEDNIFYRRGTPSGFKGRFPSWFGINFREG